MVKWKLSIKNNGISVHGKISKLCSLKNIIMIIKMIKRPQRTERKIEKCGSFSIFKFRSIV